MDIHRLSLYDIKDEVVFYNEISIVKANKVLLLRHSTRMRILGEQIEIVLNFCGKCFCG